MNRLKKSFVTISLAAASCLGTAQFVGLNNGVTGLLGWRTRVKNAIQSAKNVGDLSGFTRLNIVCIGHSIEEGVQDCPPPDLPDPVAWRYSNLLRRYMRSSAYGLALNARGSKTLGGHGFISSVDSGATPILAGPGSYIGGERYGTWTDHRFNDPDRAPGATRKYMESSVPGSYARFYLYKPSWDKMFSDVPTAVEFLYQQFPGGGKFQLELTNYPGTEVYQTLLIDTNSNDGKIHYGVRTPLFPTTNPNMFWVVIRNVSQGNQPIRWEGTNFYANDQDYGIHVTNFACGGATAEAYESDENIEAVMAQDPSVVVLWLDYNDVIGIRAEGYAYWRAKMLSTIQKLVSALGSSRSLLVKLGFDPVGGPWPVWEQMNADLNQWALAYNFAFLSHHEYAGRQSANQFAVPLGVLEPNMVHYTRLVGQPFEATLVQRALLFGVAGRRNPL
jgi:hypothetical protein